MENTTSVRLYHHECSDNSFYPSSCDREFDFTLLFEQIILSTDIRTFSSLCAMATLEIERPSDKDYTKSNIHGETCK